MKTSLIKLDIGSHVQVIDDNRIGKIQSINLTPNGINSPEIVALLTVKFFDGKMLMATSNKFKPLPDMEYEEFYPSVHLNNLP